MVKTELERAFDAFADAVRQNENFGFKTTVLFHLAAPMTAGCYP